MVAFGSVCAQNAHKSCHNQIKLNFINGNSFLNKIKNKTGETVLWDLLCLPS